MSAARAIAVTAVFLAVLPVVASSSSAPVSAAASSVVVLPDPGGANPNAAPRPALFEQSSTLLDEGSDRTTVRSIARGNLDGDAADEVVAIVGGPAASNLQLVVFDRDGDSLVEAGRYDGPAGGDTAITSLVLTDVDDDGLLDAVSASDSAQELRVRSGDGAGGFGEERSVSLALTSPADDNDPLVLRTAQLDADDADEVVVLAEDRGSDPVPIWVLDPTTSGFDTSVLFLPATFTTGAADIGVADLDGVGPDEVVVVPPSGALPVLVLSADGSGELMLPAATDCGVEPARNACTGSFWAQGAIQFADVDDDDDLDVVLGTNDAFYVGENDGSGAVEFSRSELGYRSGLPFSATRSGDTGPVDLDGDGADDVLFAPSSAGADNVLATGFGDGQGELDFTFHVALPGPAARSTPPGQIEPNGVGAVIPVDANGDGRLDVVVGANSGPVGLALLVGDDTKAGGFRAAQIRRPSGSVPYLRDASALADMDGDGRDDLVTVAGRDMVIVEPGQADGSLGQAIETDLNGSVSCLASLAVGDIDGDGANDLACTALNNAGGRISVAFGDGAAGFVDPSFVQLDNAFNGSTFFQTIRVADLDGDGRSEIVAGHRAQVDGVSNTSRVSIVGAPAERPRDLTVLQQVSPAGLGNQATNGDVVVVGDVTGDQIPDIVYSAEAGGTTFGLRSTIVTLPGRGDGTVGLPREMRLADGVAQYDMAIGDLDRDGQDDLVSIDNNRRAIGVLLSTGDGFFEYVQQHEPDMDAGASDVELADLDGDGNLDIVATSATVAAGRVALHVYLGRGDGTFDDPIWPTNGYLRLVDAAIGDLDADGALDLVGTWGGRTIHRGVSAPALGWLGPFDPVVHGTITLSWVAPPGVIPTAEIEPVGGGAASPLLVDTAAQTVSLDTTGLGDGDYTVRLSGDGRSDEFDVEIRNDGVTWHEGPILGDEVWGAGTVHYVTSAMVMDGGSLTIGENAIVKVVRGGSIVSDDANDVTVAATAVVTSVEDPVGEGATDVIPADGTWSGVIDRFGLPIDVDGEVRHEAWRHRAPLDDDFMRTWTDEQLHIIDSSAWATEDVPDALVIDPGAVVKFTHAGSLNATGDLTIRGTPGNPVTFTSIHDDSVGGDTDGTEQQPAAGDWLWVQGERVVDVDGARFAYGSGPFTTVNTGFYGMLNVAGFESGASTTVRNSTFRDAASGGISVGGPAAAIENVVVTRTRYGIVQQTNPGTTITNATLHDNDSAISSSYTSFSNPVFLRNSSVTDYDLAFRARFGSSYVASSHNNVVSDRAGSSVGRGDFAVGSNGNIAETPGYLATTGDDAFELRPGSALIDAADGSVAPSTDLLSRARVDNPGVVDTGVADGDGVVPDIGAFEAVATFGPLPELVISDVQAPGAVVPGTVVSLSYRVTNTGEEAAGGEQVHQVRLLPAGGVPSTDVTRRAVVEFIDLGPGESEEVAIDVAVPAILPGPVVFEITLDVDDVLFEESENVPGGLDGPAPGHVGLSDPVSLLTVAELVRDGPSASFALDGRSQRWFRLADGGPVLVEASGPAGAEVRIFAADGVLPTRSAHDGAGSVDGDSATWIADSSEQTHVLVEAEGAGGDVVVQATTPPPQISEVSPGQGFVGPLRLVVEGRLLGAVTDVLLRRDTTEVPAVSTELDPANGALTVLFDGVGLEPGVWDLELASPDGTSTAADAVELVAAPGDVLGSADDLQVEVLAPPAMRRARTTTVNLRYENVGAAPIALPTIRIEASSGGLSLFGQPPTSSLTLVPPGSSVLPFLLPGEQASLPLRYHAPDAQVTAVFDVWAETSSDPDYGSTSIDWDAIEADAPTGVAADVWTAVVDRARTTIGSTFADLATHRGAHYTTLRLAGEHLPVLLDGSWRLPPLPPNDVLTGVRQIAETAPQLRSILAQASPSAGGCTYSPGAPASPSSFAAPFHPTGFPTLVRTPALQSPTSDPPIPPGPQTVVIFIAGHTDELSSDNDRDNITQQIRESAPGVIVRTPITDGTEQEILSSISDIRDQLQADDELIIFNASHGTRDNELQTTNGDRITPDELVNAWDKQGLGVTFITDSCFSDGFAREVADKDPDVIAMSSAILEAQEERNGGPLMNRIRESLRGNPGTDLTEVPERDREQRNQRLKDLGYTDAQIDEFNRTGQLGRTAEWDEAEALKQRVTSGPDARYANTSWGDDDPAKQDIYSRMDPQSAADYLQLKGIKESDRTPEQQARFDVVGAEFTTAYEAFKVDRDAWKASPDGREFREAQLLTKKMRRETRQAVPNVFGVYGDPVRIAGGVRLGEPSTGRDTSEQEDEEVQECWFTGVTRCPDDSDETEVLTSYDPNDKTAFAGEWAQPDETLDYRIRFENDAEQAQVPAQEVIVTDVLDADLDLDSVELVSVGFGDVELVIPPGRSSWSRRISTIVQGRTEFVDIEVSLDRSTRTLEWRLTSVDPDTETFPEDPFAGFLPPNDATGVGEGSLFFRVDPLPGLGSGTVIENAASIVFDTNDAIITNTVSTTLDDDLPVVSVDGLPSTSTSTSVPVFWSTSDATSGVERVDVYVSVDGGPWALWQRGVTQRSATWSGVDGTTVRFIARGSDRAGNPEVPADAVEARTSIVVPDDPVEDPGLRIDAGAQATVAAERLGSSSRASSTRQASEASGLRVPVVRAPDSGEAVAAFVELLETDAIIRRRSPMRIAPILHVR